MINIINTLFIICNNAKDYFSWEPEKINVKLHKNCENTGKILKISCVRFHFVKFGICIDWIAIMLRNLLSQDCQGMQILSIT